MKKYLVSDPLMPYLRRILDRRMAEYHFSKEGDVNYCNMVVSSDGFHRLVMRAACEKRSEEDGVTYVTKAESNNPIYLAKLRKEIGAEEVFIMK